MNCDTKGELNAAAVTTTTTTTALLEEQSHRAVRDSPLPLSSTHDIEPDTLLSNAKAPPTTTTMPSHRIHHHNPYCRKKAADAAAATRPFINEAEQQVRALYAHYTTTRRGAAQHNTSLSAAAGPYSCIATTRNSSSSSVPIPDADAMAKEQQAVHIPTHIPVVLDGTAGVSEATHLPMMTEPPPLSVATSIADADAGTMGNSNFEPQWRRLPSRNLNFGAATVLTVPEVLVQHESGSVKFIGQLTYMCEHHDDGCRSLLLRDPLHSMRTNKKRPRFSLGHAAAGTTREPPSRQPSLGPRRSFGSLSSQNRNAPLLGGGPPMQDRANDDDDVSVPLTLRKKLPPAPPARPDTTMAATEPPSSNELEQFAALLQRNDAVWVVTSTAACPSLHINDLVMIMGEFDTSTTTSAAAERAVAAVRRHDARNHRPAIMARVVKVVNGVNVALYVQALHMRRQSWTAES